MKTPNHQPQSPATQCDPPKLLHLQLRQFRKQLVRGHGRSTGPQPGKQKSALSLGPLESQSPGDESNEWSKKCAAKWGCFSLTLSLQRVTLFAPTVLFFWIAKNITLKPEDGYGVHAFQSRVRIQSRWRLPTHVSCLPTMSSAEISSMKVEIESESTKSDMGTCKWSVVFGFAFIIIPPPASPVFKRLEGVMLLHDSLQWCFTGISWHRVFASHNLFNGCNANALRALSQHGWGAAAAGITEAMIPKDAIHRTHGSPFTTTSTLNTLQTIRCFGECCCCRCCLGNSWHRIQWLTQAGIHGNRWATDCMWLLLDMGGAYQICECHL